MRTVAILGVFLLAGMPASAARPAIEKTRAQISRLHRTAFAERNPFIASRMASELIHDRAPESQLARAALEAPLLGRAEIEPLTEALGAETVELILDMRGKSELLAAFANAPEAWKARPAQELKDALDRVFSGEAPASKTKDPVIVPEDAREEHKRLKGTLVALRLAQVQSIREPAEFQGSAIGRYSVDENDPNLASTVQRLQAAVRELEARYPELGKTWRRRLFERFLRWLDS